MDRIATIVVTAAAAAFLAAACAAPPPEPEPAADSTVVSDAVRQAWEGAERNISESAQLMEEADYAFTPVDGVRSFGAILAHIAGANYVFCSAARGEEAPHAEGDFEQTTNRDEIIAVLTESLAYCAEAYAAATDASLAETIALPFGGGDGSRAMALIGNTGHLNEHYGNLVTYFRIKGIVPPSSRG